MKQLRIGVVGTGHMGRIHARALARMPQADLVGVFDKQSSRAEEVAKKYNSKAFKDIEELLSQVEAVVIATPTDTHYDVCSQCVRAGLHVLVEKPLSHDLESAKLMVQMAQEKGLVMAVGYVERFNPGLLAVKDHISNPMFIEAMRLAPYNPRGTEVDVITDLMVHDIDIVLGHFKEKPEQLSCIGVPVLTDKIDIANARLEFPSGRIASLTASRVAMQKMRKVRFFGEDTYVSVNMLTREAEMVIKRDSTILPYFPEVDDSVEPIYAEDLDFVQAITHARQPEVSGPDALATTELAYQLLKDALRRVSKR